MCGNCMNDTSNTELDALKRQVEKLWEVAVAAERIEGHGDFTKTKSRKVDELLALIAQREQAAELRGRKDQTFKVIQSLVKSGSISDYAAAHSLAMHTTLLQATKPEKDGDATA